MTILTKFLLPLLMVLSTVHSDKVQNNLKIISYPEFEEMVATPSQQLRIYNFWATWCAPCIKEMPHFEKVNAADSETSLFFISLDDGRKTERVTNFLEKRNIKAPVYLLDDVDYNKWIDKVHTDWSGAIPATLFVDARGNKHFHEGELSEEELKAIINKLK